MISGGIDLSGLGFALGSGLAQPLLNRVQRQQELDNLLGQIQRVQDPRVIEGLQGLSAEQKQLIGIRPQRPSILDILASGAFGGLIGGGGGGFIPNQGLTTPPTLPQQSQQGPNLLTVEDEAGNRFLQDPTSGKLFDLQGNPL